MKTETTQKLLDYIQHQREGLTEIEAALRKEIKQSDIYPGEGYRLLGAYEVIREGDEFCWHGSDVWIVSKSIGITVGISQPSYYRRKIAYGWRKSVKHEFHEKTTEGGFYYRRKLPVNPELDNKRSPSGQVICSDLPQPSEFLPKGYRYLDMKETIQLGDSVWDDTLGGMSGWNPIGPRRQGNWTAM